MKEGTLLAWITDIYYKNCCFCLCFVIRLCFIFVCTKRCNDGNCCNGVAYSYKFTRLYLGKYPTNAQLSMQLRCWLENTSRFIVYLTVTTCSIKLTPGSTACNAAFKTRGVNQWFVLFLCTSFLWHAFVLGLFQYSGSLFSLPDLKDILLWLPQKG